MIKFMSRHGRKVGSNAPYHLTKKTMKLSSMLSNQDRPSTLHTCWNRVQGYLTHYLLSCL